MYAALTTGFWLSVAFSLAGALSLIVEGAAKRRYLVLAIGILALLASVGWLMLGLLVEGVGL